MPISPKVQKPVSTHEQREAVRMLAMLVGVREAARQSGISEARVMQWSKRYKWLANRQPQLPVTMQSDLVSTVSKTADKLSVQLASYAKTTRHNLAKASDKASQALAKRDGDKLVEANVAKAAREWTDVASKVHGWDRDKTAGASNLQLNVLAGRGRTLIAIQSDDNATPPEKTVDI